MPASGAQFYLKHRKPKLCVVCSSEFIPFSGVHKFCSEKCKGKWKYVTGQIDTDRQYREISGNWTRYASRLLACGGHRRSQITRDIILKKLEEQKYKCALSGLPLTCNLKKGVRFLHNASVDRINAGGTYTEDNIQLVCQALNKFRLDTSVEEFVGWCKAVVEHQAKQKYAKSP